MQVKFKSVRPNSWTLKEGGAGCGLYAERDGTWFITTLFTEPSRRNQGDATHLLKQIVRAARRLNKRVRLIAAPFADRPYDLTNLIKFYTKAGFKEGSSSSYSAEMIYEGQSQ